MTALTLKLLKRLPPLAVGDKVIRNLAGTLMPMVVLSIKPNGVIVCGGPQYQGAEWEFEPKFGTEVDEYLTNLAKELGMDTGIISYIVPMPKKGEA